MTRAFIGIGSNIDPAANTAKAVRSLSRVVRITGISTVYRTEAEGRPEQALYYNCVVEVETEMPPLELKLRVLRGIETELGRVRSSDKFAARTIDLDLILYDDLVTATAELTLPAPDIARRPFLAIPLHELAPGLVLPGEGLRISEAAAVLERGTMQPLERYTEQLRKEILHERK